MRVVNFNIKGARIPGRMNAATQERSWHLLAAYGADLALVQEAELKAIPAWAREHWALIHGEWEWGSVIAARPSLNLRPRRDLAGSRMVGLLSDYAAFGEIDSSDGAPVVVVSVHAPASKLPAHLKTIGKEGALSAEEMSPLAQPGDDPWAIDLFFAAISEVVRGRRFIAGGDWNNSRLFDLDRKKGELPFATMFFTRAKAAGWFECHGRKNEERSFLNPNQRPHQLDHLFCDTGTGERLGDCSVRLDWMSGELSDHAAMVTDFAAV